MSRKAPKDPTRSNPTMSRKAGPLAASMGLLGVFSRRVGLQSAGVADSHCQLRRTGEDYGSIAAPLAGSEQGESERRSSHERIGNYRSRIACLRRRCREHLRAVSRELVQAARFRAMPCADAPRTPDALVRRGAAGLDARGMPRQGPMGKPEKEAGFRLTGLYVSCI